MFIRFITPFGDFDTKDAPVTPAEAAQMKDFAVMAAEGDLLHARIDLSRETIYIPKDILLRSIIIVKE